ncbi:hypothetical protein DUI87_16091 [Hirundo rustica rustica]|uniref:Uncharacterized protein n=1 Tax=Hirundo rustica rustica TaxID=333673 RepID=A0A3M0K0F8_HIRRU|nr:hypothetical protein DUI87_16091 [Hirundo rustica rustica]
MSNHPFCEEIPPYVQPEPSTVQLEAVSPCPVTDNLGEELKPHLATTSFQMVVESSKEDASGTEKGSKVSGIGDGFEVVASSA